MDLKPNHWYRFDTYAPSVLGTQFTRMKLETITSFDRAIKEENVLLQAKKIQPLLPEGTPTNPRNYTYYIFVSVDGKTRLVLASYWIIEESLQEVERARAVITLDNIDTSDINTIRDQLRVMGYTFSIETA